VNAGTPSSSGAPSPAPDSTLAALAAAAAAPRTPSPATRRARTALAKIAGDAAAGRRTVPLADYKAAQALDMLEAALQTRIIAEADKLGYLVYHTHDSRKSRRGFPDLCLAHAQQPRLIFAELKRQKEDLRPDQRVWAAVLRGLPFVEYYTWRPGDLLSNGIKNILEARPA
jgi:hypothetical protein